MVALQLCSSLHPPNYAGGQTARMRLSTVLLQVTVFLAFTILPVEGFLCKWSNEGCSSDKECCSGRCEQGHPGTDARCTKSVLHQPCLYTYQCEDRLKCGSHNKCCSNYWGTCRRPSDCCNKMHYCLEVDGFYYKRCLSGTNVNINAASQSLVFSPYVFTTCFIILAPFTSSRF
ncbi:uncharacterized protein LOC124118715 isoform X1 [Haliotis rufescens]|uniref:uncharacterized protein LOC124118715 isoform X1 n=1 Tax=Haliotis rufescens TaxID=6454 RepID=UPI001EAF9C43|nr:uncharacterized protein LOC124118715 isoform X1 [Haliotis rufescens]